jgi:hypothetical protein
MPSVRKNSFLLIILIRETAVFACIFGCVFRTEAGIKRKNLSDNGTLEMKKTIWRKSL